MKHIYSILRWSFLFAFIFIATANAQQQNDANWHLARGFDYLHAKQYAAARRCFNAANRLCDGKDPVVLDAIGLSYSMQSYYSQAVYWYTQSANKGYALGQYHLAQCYEKGVSVDKDIEKALYWYKKAAEQGDKNAIAKVSKIEGKQIDDDWIWLWGFIF